MASTATATNVSAQAETMQLRLASGNGPITRTIRRTPLRDASPSEIPLIDVSPMFSDSLADRQGVARKVHDAATNNGFFYISNHGIPAEVTDSAHVACLDFFRQDMDVKMKTDANKGSFHNGYRAPDTQRLNPDEGVDIRESYTIRYDPRIDPTIADPSSIPEQAAKYLHIHNSPWENTENLPHFKESFVRYFQACLVLARALTRAFALSLGLDEGAFDSKVQYPDAAFGLNYYPPIAGGSSDKAAATLTPGDPDARVSIGSHTDFQLFTILWQDSNGGLQVLNREGQWIGARPVEGTFVVNIADYLQRITNDRYVSTVHRAQNWSGRERVSMPFFWGFGLHESCGVLDSCVAEGEEKKYGEIRCIDWFNRRIGNMLDLSEENACNNGRSSKGGGPPITGLQAGAEAGVSAEPCHHLPPQGAPPPERSLLPGPPPLHEVRPARLPVEPVRRRGADGALVRQAAAADAAQLALAVVVPPAAAQDHDGRAGQALPVARAADEPRALEQRAVEDARGPHGEAQRGAAAPARVQDPAQEPGAPVQGEEGPGRAGGPNAQGRGQVVQRRGAGPEMGRRAGQERCGAAGDDAEEGRDDAAMSPLERTIRRRYQSEGHIVKAYRMGGLPPPRRHGIMYD